MTNIIMNDEILNAYAKDIAKDYYHEEYSEDQSLQDYALESAQYSEYAIYTNKAKAVCFNCNIGHGESVLAEQGVPKRFNDICTAIACAEIAHRIVVQYKEFLSDLELLAELGESV